MSPTTPASVRRSRRRGLPPRVWWPFRGRVSPAVTAVLSMAALIAAVVAGWSVSASAATASPVKGLASQRCLDLPRFVTADGTQPQLWDCNGGSNQQWTLTSADEIRGLGNKCLDDRAYGTGPGTRLILWDCTGGRNQQWRIAGNGSIVSVSSGLCLDATGAATVDATVIQLWTCNGGANQSWTPPVGAGSSTGTGTPGTGTGIPTSAPSSTSTGTSSTSTGTSSTSTGTAGSAPSHTPSSTPPSTAGSTPTSTAGSTPTGTAGSTPTSIPSATPTGTGTAAPSHFSTRAPGSTLPSDAQCTSWVRSVATPAEVRPDNERANSTTGESLAGATGLTARVDGNFTGTTEQILRWAACKWGIDEDIVKAQAVQESYWHMSQLGDWENGSTASPCAPNHGLGVDGKAGLCPESVGILQVRWPYHSVAFPSAEYSTAENADYAYSQWRSCYEGKDTWLTNGYRAGDAWGCVGSWFSGQFHDAGANGYIADVQSIVSKQTWAQPNF